MKKIAKLLLVLIFLVGVGGGAYFYDQTQKLQTKIDELLADPAIEAREELRIILDKVGRLVVLPEGEDPILATVTDKDALAGQEFFARAENGDKVLIYPKAKKIYLYDPEGDKLLEVAPLNIGEVPAKDEEGEVEPTPEASSLLNIENN